MTNIAPEVAPKVAPKVARTVAPTEVPTLAPTVYDSICQFCKLEFPNRQLQEHEDYCGSRTEQCEECGDFVMLRDWEKHQNMRLYHELAKKPSSEVFKRDDSRTRTTSTYLQRSTSGLNLTSNMSTSALNIARNTTATTEGQPFGSYFRSPLQESKSMKNIANVSTSHYLIKNCANDRKLNCLFSEEMVYH